MECDENLVLNLQQFWGNGGQSGLTVALSVLNPLLGRCTHTPHTHIHTRGTRSTHTHVQHTHTTRTTHTPHTLVRTHTSHTHSRTHTHMCVHLQMHTHTPHTRAHTHVCTHTHTHTHTHTQSAKNALGQNALLPNLTRVG